MWVWLLFVFIPPLALGPIRIRDAGWAIGRWPKKLSPPESQVSNVTGDCNALKKTLMKYSSLRGLKGYLSRSLLASLKRAWWLLKAAKVMKMFPQKSISHPRTPPDPPTQFFSSMAVSKIPAIVIFHWGNDPVTIAPGQKGHGSFQFSGPSDGRGWWLPGVGSWGSTAGLSYPTPEIASKPAFFGPEHLPGMEGWK